MIRAEPDPHSDETDETMYEMYPDDWAPSQNRHEGRQAAKALQVALDLRDNGGQRPDDN
ncbi:MAG: hypothetical protein H0U47_11430 [Nocardioidaceae bacterium]|nr:hypothetical protein [Nocardioidaceae bacterium]